MDKEEKFNIRSESWLSWLKKKSFFKKTVASVESL